MLSEDMPDAVFTHTVRGFFGETLTIGAYPPEDPDDGGAVQFLVRDENGRTATAHISSPREREAFAGAWMEACRVADGEKPPAGRIPERVPEAAPSPADPGPCPACRKPLSGHERGSDGVTYLCPVIGSACIASHPEDGEPCEVKGPHGRHRYTPYAGSGTGDVQKSWTDADSLAHAIRHGLPVTLVHDEVTDAASAADAARDAREAWNDPEGGDSRDVQ